MGQKYSNEAIERAIELREAGDTWAVIEAETGVPQGSASYHCHCAGVASSRFVEPGSFEAQIDKNGRVSRAVTAEEDRVIVAMREAGQTVSAISKRTGRAINTVKYRLRRAALLEEATKEALRV